MSSVASVEEFIEQKINISFNDPFAWQNKFMKVCNTYNGIKVECSICCDVNIPFVLIRSLIDKRNFVQITSDHKIGHNFDYFYPQFVCAKCATWFCLQKQDPVRATCLAGLPMICMKQINNVIFENYLESFSKLTNMLYKTKCTKNDSSILYYLASAIVYGAYYLVSTQAKKIA